MSLLCLVYIPLLTERDKQELSAIDILLLRSKDLTVTDEPGARRVEPERIDELMEQARRGLAARARFHQLGITTFSTGRVMQACKERLDHDPLVDESMAERGVGALDGAPRELPLVRYNPEGASLRWTLSMRASIHTNQMRT